MLMLMLDVNEILIVLFRRSKFLQVVKKFLSRTVTVAFTKRTNFLYTKEQRKTIEVEQQFTQHLFRLSFVRHQTDRNENDIQRRYSSSSAMDARNNERTYHSDVQWNDPRHSE